MQAVAIEFSRRRESKPSTFENILQTRQGQDKAGNESVIIQSILCEVACKVKFNEELLLETETCTLNKFLSSTIL